MDTQTTGNDNGVGRKRAPENETKREKFERLVDYRVQKALVAIRTVAKLGGANAKNYDFGGEDIRAAMGALRAEIDRCEQLLSLVQPKQVPLFSIKRGAGG